MGKTIFISGLAVVLLACHSTPKPQQVEPGSISLRELPAFLGHNIDSLPDLGHLTRCKIVMHGDEDEDLSWNTMNYYRGETAVLSMEANWKQPNLVSRITVWAPLNDTDSIYVGQRYAAIEDYVSPDIPSSPDGELFVRLKDANDQIYLQIDISKNEKLFYGTTDLNMIPDSLQVTSIVIMK